MVIRQSHNNKYVTKLPVAGVAKARYKSGVELLRLKDGKQKWITGNLELRNGLPLFIYTPYNDWYWYRHLQYNHDLKVLRRYIADGNLYIYFDDIWQERVREEQKKQGMPYYQYNKLRELMIADEMLDTEDPSYLIKKRAINIEIKKINHG